LQGKKVVVATKIDRNFDDDTTVETAIMSSFDYKYMTINNFYENIDDSLATLDNIVIMTINDVNGSLTSFGDTTTLASTTCRHDTS
jgi:hypothetical protein